MEAERQEKFVNDRYLADQANFADQQNKLGKEALKKAKIEQQVNQGMKVWEDKLNAGIHKGLKLSFSSL